MNQTALKGCATVSNPRGVIDRCHRWNRALALSRVGIVTHRWYRALATVVQWDAELIGGTGLQPCRSMPELLELAYGV
jgi:hypothetical protein